MGRGTVSTWRASGCCSADRKSTRLNSSHSQISYAVFCLKKKQTHRTPRSKKASYQHEENTKRLGKVTQAHPRRAALVELETATNPRFFARSDRLNVDSVS